MLFLYLPYILLGGLWASVEDSASSWAEQGSVSNAALEPAVIERKESASDTTC
jgi:hypothetical protein